MNRAIVLLALTTGCILVPIDRTAVTRTAEPTDAGDVPDGAVTVRDAGDQVDAGELDSGDLDGSQLDSDSGVDTSDGGLTVDAGYDGGTENDAGSATCEPNQPLTTCCKPVQLIGASVVATCVEDSADCHQYGGVCSPDAGDPYLCCCSGVGACYLSTV
jgi:hypothetical protein